MEVNMSKWTNSGWENAEEQIRASGSYTRDFFLKPNEEGIIRVLDSEPQNIRDHFVNKGWYTCSGDDCVLCENGNKPTSHFVFNVLDKREWTDKAGVKHTNEVKLWRVGVKLLRLLGKKQARKGPINTYDILISRLGAGQDTTYDIDVDEDSKGTPIELPEGAELYDRESVLAPKTRSELLSIISGTAEKESEEEDEVTLPWKRK